MMEITAIPEVATIRENLHKIYAFSAAKIGVFGSVARGEASDNSDLDIVVDLKVKTLRNYMGLKFFLEEITGRKVDLVMIENIKPIIRSQILSEVRYIEE